MRTKVYNDIVISDGLPMEVGEVYPNLLILGGGKSVWDDYFAARELFDSYYVMCVNDIAGQFKVEEVHHAVSLHSPILPAVRALYRQKSMLNDFTTHSDHAAPGVDCVWNMQNSGGTSGLFAVKIAMAMGSRHIVICGIPMDNSGHYFDPPDAHLNKTDNFNVSSWLAPWEDVGRSIVARERVRSMSGNTAQLLGKPTKEWAMA